MCVLMSSKWKMEEINPHERLGGMIMSMCAYYHHDLLSGKWEKINPHEVRGGFIKIK